jgi:hypothetical protein
MITFDGKMLHIHVAIRLIVAVPIQSIVTGSNGEPAYRKFVLTFRVDQGMKHLLPFVAAQMV